MRGSIERRGPNSFRLVVSNGIDSSGKQNKLTKLFKTDETMTEAAKLKAADMALSEFKSEINRGNQAQSKGKTLDQLWQYWLSNYAKDNLAQTSLVFYANLYPRIKAALGNMRIDRIKPEHVQQFYKNLGEVGVKCTQQKKGDKEGKPPEKLSSCMIRQYHTALSQLFNHAVRWDFMNSNPCSRVTPPKARPKEKPVYSFEETGAMLQALESEEVHHQLQVLMTLTTGIRNEELFGLRWSDIDGATIHIRQCRVYLGKDIGTITKEPKNTGSIRDITIDDEILSLLKKHKANEATQQLKLGSLWKNTPLVFSTWDGDGAHPQSFRSFLNRFTKKHNLPKLSPHVFRHMAASFMINKGTDIRTVSGKLGHTKTSTTMNTYSHLIIKSEPLTTQTMTSVIAEARQAHQDNKKIGTKGR